MNDEYKYNRKRKTNERRTLRLLPKQPKLPKLESMNINTKRKNKWYSEVRRGRYNRKSKITEQNCLKEKELENRKID